MAELQHSGVPGQPDASAAITQIPGQREGPVTGAAPRWEAGDGFSGWAWFAGGLLGLVGVFQVMAGIVALAKSDYYAVPARSLLVDSSYTAWGWVHLILGLVALGAGGGLVFGSTVARVVGVALAALSALVNLAFIPAAPFAATLVVAVDVVVIYAIIVHGGEPKGAR